MVDENCCPNVASPVRVGKSPGRVNGLARAMTPPRPPTTPTSADKRATDAMFDLVYSPPVPPGRKTVAFKCGAALGRDKAFVGGEEKDGNELVSERKKLERFKALADSGRKNNCNSPAPWRLLPRRETLTPGDAESRETKRYLAALRLQTLLHHRRAERARVKTLRLERTEREKAEREKCDRASRRTAVEAQRKLSATQIEDRAKTLERRAKEAESKVAEMETRLKEVEREKQAALSSLEAKFEARRASDAARTDARLAELFEEKEAADDGELLVKVAEAEKRAAEAEQAQEDAKVLIAAKLSFAEAHMRAQEEKAKADALELAAAKEHEQELFKAAEAEREAGLAEVERRAEERCAAVEKTAAERVQRADDDLKAQTENAKSAAKAESAEAVAIALKSQSQLAEMTRAFDGDRQAWDGLRRKLHNRVVELQGNIRVFVRVRPSLDVSSGKTTAIDAALAVSCPRTSAGNSGDAVEVPETIPPGGPPRKPRVFKFAFDRVLPSESTQSEVFEEVRPFAQSALDGYRVCVFAYGQTGSGKTHTVFGTKKDPGLLRRSLELVFDGVRDLRRTQGWEFSLTVEMLEIYTEKIYDLCSPELEAETEPKRLSVRDTGEEIHVEGLSRLAVESADEALEKLARATKRRHVGATKSNSTSSRSHAIFALRIEGVHPATGEKRSGVLNLVDLAGSERLAVSGSNEGDPQLLKEAQSINSSLSALGSTISALAQSGSAAASHVPFRNSRLTFLLQPCLGGDAKTLAIFCLAPELKHERETLCTLRFGQKVSKCAPKGSCAKCGARAVEKS